MWNGGPDYSVAKTNKYYNKVMKAYNEKCINISHFYLLKNIKYLIKIFLFQIL